MSNDPMGCISAENQQDDTTGEGAHAPHGPSDPDADPDPPPQTSCPANSNGSGGGNCPSFLVFCGGGSDCDTSPIFCDEGGLPLIQFLGSGWGGSSGFPLLPLLEGYLGTGGNDSSGANYFLGPGAGGGYSEGPGDGLSAGDPCEWLFPGEMGPEECGSSAVQQAVTHCIGGVRAIGKGNVHTPPVTGGYPPILVTNGTGTIIATQFYPTMSYIDAKDALYPYLGTISGVVFDPNSQIPSRSFNGITDAIGGHPITLTNGQLVTPAQLLQMQFPGLFILEINGVNEPRGSNDKSTILLTQSPTVPCPVGTLPLSLAFPIPR